MCVPVGSMKSHLAHQYYCSGPLDYLQGVYSCTPSLLIVGRLHKHPLVILEDRWTIYKANIHVPLAYSLNDCGQVAQTSTSYFRRQLDYLQGEYVTIHSNDCPV